VVCDLPADGALAVLCDECVAGNARINFVAVGYLRQAETPVPSTTTSAGRFGTIPPWITTHEVHHPYSDNEREAAWKALREQFPWGPRKCHPYDVWLDEGATSRGQATSSETRRSVPRRARASCPDAGNDHGSRPY